MYLKYNAPKKIPIAIFNGSNYDYHFFIKKLAEEFEKQLTWLGENTEKYTTFSAPKEKDVTGADKNGEEILQKIYLTR